MYGKLKLMGIALFALALSACAPEPGSRAWCELMDEKPKGDWSANDAAEYAKSCLFESEE